MNLVEILHAQIELSQDTNFCLSIVELKKVNTMATFDIMSQSYAKILLSTFVSYQFPTLWLFSIRSTYECAVLKSFNYSDYIFTRALYRRRNIRKTYKPQNSICSFFSPASSKELKNSPHHILVSLDSE